MLRRSLHLLDLPALAGRAEGERRLTNFLHLAEALLQQAGATLEGEAALVRWLAMTIEAGGSGAGEEQVVRLESDADLVKVVTVHKTRVSNTRGLPPFATSFRAVERRTARYPQARRRQRRRRLALDYDDADLERAEAERLREDLRLFYVALTRARHALWMGFARGQDRQGQGLPDPSQRAWAPARGRRCARRGRLARPLQALATAAAQDGATGTEADGRTASRSRPRRPKRRTPCCAGARFCRRCRTARPPRRLRASLVAR